MNGEEYIAVLMRKKSITNGVGIYFPDHIIEGTIEKDEYDFFVDNYGNEHLLMTDGTTAFSDEDVVGFLILQKDLLKKYEGLSKNEALIEYFDDVSEMTHISFYHYDTGKNIFLDFNFSKLFDYINENKLVESSNEFSFDLFLNFSGIIESLFDRYINIENSNKNISDDKKMTEAITIEPSYLKELLKLSDSEFKSKINQIYNIYENATETKELNNQKVIEKIDKVYNEILKIDDIKLLNRLSSNLEEMYLELVLSLDSSYSFSNDKIRDEIENFLYRTIDTYHSLANSSDIEKIKNTMASIRDRQKIHFSTLLMEENREQQERAEKQKELEEIFSNDFDNKEKNILFNPKEMKKFFDKKIIGQEEAKKDVISAIYMNSLADESISKNTCLLVGPTGSGKTLIAESVAEFLNLPFVNIDTTQLTMPGYVGANIEDFLGRLIESANGDIEKAESGIVMLDEIDKKGSESNGDVAGKGVLNTLLPFVQGTTYDVRYNNRKVSFDTSKLTIFMTGAFTDVAKGVSENSSYTDSKIGFGTSQESQNKEDIAYKKLNIEDFVKHGDFPVELVGRVSNIVQLSGHTKESLKTILTDSNISVLNLEAKKLKKINVEIKYSDDYLDAVAEKALKLKTGARSLKSTVENSIKEARWEAITSDQFKSIILNKDCVEDNLKAVLVYNDGNYTTVEDLRNKEVEKAVEKVKK